MRRRNVFGLIVGLGARTLGSGLRRGEQVSGALDVLGANRAGDEAVVSDPVEAARQHVQEKAADELDSVERHGLEPVAAFDPVVLPLEGDALLVERDEPGIRDRDAVGVARQVSEDGLRPGERPLGVDDPFRAAQRRAGETFSARLSASREGWDAFSAAASDCRARSMLSARTAPAMRP